MAVSASGGSLKERATENKTSASLFFEYDSLVSSQPFFSSQAQASLADVTGLTEALICASKSDLGEKFRLPGADALLLDPRDELRGLFFGLDESPIMGGGGGKCGGERVEVWGGDILSNEGFMGQGDRKLRKKYAT
jgi:hypothetical protein